MTNRAAFVLLLVVIWFCITSDAAIRDYFVSKLQPNAPEITAVAKKIYEKQYADFLKQETVRVRTIQHISGNAYLVSLSGTTYFVELPETRIIPDDEVIVGSFLKTSEVYVYSSVGGAKRTIAKLIVIKEPKLMTTERLIECLKAGETFFVEFKSNEKCQDCYGFGHVQKRGFGNAPPKDVPCPKCKGEGKVPKTDFLHIRW